MNNAIVTYYFCNYFMFDTSIFILLNFSVQKSNTVLQSEEIGAAVQGQITGLSIPIDSLQQ